MEEIDTNIRGRLEEKKEQVSTLKLPEVNEETEQTLPKISKM